MPIDALYEAIRNAPNQQGWQAAQQREAASHQAAIDEAVRREEAAQQAQQLWNGYDYEAEAARRAQVGGFNADNATQQVDPLVQAMYYAQQSIPNGRWQADPQQMGQRFTTLPGTDVPADSARGQAIQAIDLQAGAAKAVQDAIDPFAFSNTTPGILGTKDRTRAYTTAGEILRSADSAKQQIADYNTDADFARAQEAQQKAADSYRRQQTMSETEAGNQLAELYRQRDELQKLIGTTSSAFLDTQGQELNRTRQEQLARINAQIRQYETDINAVEKNRLLNEYAKNAYNADFAENSQYRKTYGDEAVQSYGLGALFGGTGENKYVDIDDNARLYELINGNSEIKEQKLQDTQNAGGPAAAAIVNAADPLQVVKYMSDKEKALFNYIYNTQGGDAARQYYDLLVADLNARYNVAETQRWAKEAKEHPLGASIASVAASPMKGLSLVGQTADMLSGKGIDTNDPYNTFSNMPAAVRSQVAHDIERNYGKAGSFAYDTAMSMADNLWQMAITGGEPGQNLMLAIMGSGAAADSVRAAKARGLSDGQAYALGLMNGVIEAATEKIGLDALYEGIRGGKTALRAILNSTLAEGSEEVLGTFLDDIADMIIAGADSERLQRIAELKAQGMSDREAANRAFVELLKEAGVAGLSGALSGLLMSGGAQSIMRGYNSAATASGPTNVFSQQYNENALNEEYLNPNEGHQWQYGSDILAEQERQERRAKAEERRSARAEQSSSVTQETATNPAISPQTAPQTANDTAEPARAETPIQDAENGQASLFAADDSGTVITQPTAQTDTEQTLGNTVGAAETGFNYTEFPHEQKVSAQAETTMRYDPTKGRAAGQSARAWRQALTYTTQSDAEVNAKADEALDYADSYEGGVEDLMEDLRYTPGLWNAVESVVARRIGTRLEQESLNARRAANEAKRSFGTNSTEYKNALETAKDAQAAVRDWNKLMQDDARGVARAMQIRTQWSGRGNEDGSRTERTAVRAIENNENLSADDKTALTETVQNYMDDILLVDEDVKDGSISENEGKQNLINIIVDIGQKRGTLANGAITRIVTENLSALTFDELKQAAFAESGMLAFDKTATDPWQIAKTIQVLNMLSNPKTFATNVLSNTAFRGIDKLAMRGAALMDALLEKATGTRSVAWEDAVSRRIWDEVRHAAAKSIVEIALDIDMGGEGKYSPTGTQNFRAQGGEAALPVRAMRIWERNNNFALVLPDEMAKAHTRGSVSRSMEKLTQEGRIRSRNENYAQTYADDLASYRTFQNTRLASDITKGLHDAFNLISLSTIKQRNAAAEQGEKLKWKDIDPAKFGLGDLIAPFSKIGGNLVGVALDYSPVKFLTGIAQTIELLVQQHRADINGTEGVSAEQQARAVSNLGRGFTGTALSLGLYILARAGIIRRGKDEDKSLTNTERSAVNSLNKAEGRYGTQINMSAFGRWLAGKGGDWQDGDKLYDLSRFEPFNFFTDYALMLADNWDDADGVVSYFGGAAQAVLDATGNNVGDMPVFQTLSNFNNARSYGDTWYQAAISSLGKTAVSSSTPNILAAFAKGMDDKQRDLYSHQAGGDGLLDILSASALESFDYAKSRLPFLRDTLPVKTGTDGKPLANPGSTAQRLLNAMLNPLGTNTLQQSEASAVLEQIRDATGEANFYPRVRTPSDLQYTEKGEKHTVTLDYEQRQKFQEDYSTAYWSAANAMVKLPEFKHLTPEEQAKALKKLESYAYQTTKRPYVGDKHVDAWVRNAPKNTAALARYIVSNR